MSIPELWVALQSHNSTTANRTKVSTKDCNYVYHFIKAVKKELSPDLDAVDVDQIFLHFTENSATLDPGLLLSELSIQVGYVQNTYETPLYLTTSIPCKKRPANLLEKLHNLGVQCTQKEIDYLIDKDPQTLSILYTDLVTRSEAQTIMTHVLSLVRTETRDLIFEEHSYGLYGPIKTGQGKTTFYTAMNPNGELFIAKVYNEHFAEFKRQVEINAQLDHENIIKFIKSFSIQNNKRHIILMPLFQESLFDLYQNCSIPLRAIKIYARDCFNALSYLHSKEFCFADMKPSNVMIKNGAGRGIAVLIDFGSTVRLGELLIASTKEYCLDFQVQVGGEEMDWICLGTTLAQISGFDITTLNTVQSLSYEVSNSDTDENLKQMILSCLNSPSAAKIDSAFK